MKVNGSAVAFRVEGLAACEKNKLNQMKTVFEILERPDKEKCNEAKPLVSLVLCKDYLPTSSLSHLKKS